MAALNQIAKYYRDEIACGIAWVAIWKTGRVWNAEAFWPEDGGYDEGYIFASEDIERMTAILAEDHAAVMLNGYYTNCGAYEDGSATIKDLVSGIEWNYYNSYNRLHGFYDGWVIR